MDLKELSDAFREYDTSYYDPDVVLQQYPLPDHGDYLVLLLLSEKGDLWTTIRPEKFGKFQYYKDLVGKVIDCRITEDD